MNYSDWMQQNPELVNQVQQRFQPQQQMAAPMPVQAVTPMQTQAAGQAVAQQRPMVQQDDEAANRIAGLMKQQKGGDGGGGLMNMAGTILSFLA